MTPYSRRSFLKQAAGAASTAFTAPLILSSRVTGAEGQVKPSNRVAMGFIGTGRQCLNVNLPSLLNEDDVQVVAVCDADQWRMNYAREKEDAFYAEHTTA